nr:voltage-gated chloride channel family protein [uncultured Pedobacter sp.]
MKHRITSEHFSIFNNLVKWTILTLPIALAIGSMVALFLWLLNWAIFFRFSHTWLLFLLPVSGLVIHFLYKLWGKSSEKGNNMIMDEIHQPGGGVPARMGPLVLVTTVITHLFGGSAGREGTAVQIGGSIAQLFGKWFNLKPEDMRIILTAGIAAGFGAVFGTPLTGAIFAMEVITLGKIQYDALIPCLIASLVGDFTVAAWGIHHTLYHIDFLQGTNFIFAEHLHWDILLILKIVAASICFGLSSYLFSEMVHGVKNVSLKIFKITWLIPFIGGLTIIGLTYLVGKPDYLSLGVNAEYHGAVTLVSAFKTGGADTWSWFWKTIFTTITLGTGFKGGEVTPLFYIGATLGNTLANLMNAPISLFAALGFIAVFAGATNTPLACTIMGVELFGGEYLLFFAIACFTAYFFSGHSGIYSSQRIGVPKVFNEYFSEEISLAQSHHRRRNFFNKKIEKYRNSLTKKTNKDE